MKEESQTRLRALPKVDDLVRQVGGEPRWAVVEAARRVIGARREAILRGDAARPIEDAEVAALAASLGRPSLRRVINATGVVLHTNLGRAPLAARAVARVSDVAAGYANVELGERGRGSRHDHVRGHLRALTGAEDALVVNNGAAAVLVALAGLAAGREAIVSRGELVEIGGSFRIPDVMRAGGVRLVEVGTTNKTHLRDYEGAIGPDTGVLLKVHRSNFVQLGFVAEVGLEELSRLGPPVLADLGSGALWPIGGEPLVSAAIKAGTRVVTFSGDKLLGGPQAGILVGDRASLALIAKHPILRAVRPDKLVLAALEATLELHREGRGDEIPAVRALTRTSAELRARAERLGLPVVELKSVVGGGALPGLELPSFGVTLPAALDDALRRHDPPIIGRLSDGQLVLDVRALLDEEIPVVAAFLQGQALSIKVI
jgi:L-seryl-tRNA(Ser) seleniumtransferase